MLTLKANLERKPTDFNNHFCQIEKIIELPKNEFDSLVSHPYRDRDFISENRELMGHRNGAYHCLLVLGEDGNDGVLIEAEGAGYIRYGAYISHARTIVMKQMEQVADCIIRDAVSNTSSGSWITHFEEIHALSGMEISNENGYAPLLMQALEARPELAEIEMTAECYDIVYYLDYCTNLDGDSLEARDHGRIRLRDMLLLGGMENVYMVHEASNACCASADDFAMLTSKGREDYAELLNAAVVKIHTGVQGIEVVLSGFEPHVLMDFAQAADSHSHAENMMGPTL